MDSMVDGPDSPKRGPGRSARCTTCGPAAVLAGLTEAGTQELRGLTEARAVGGGGARTEHTAAAMLTVALRQLGCFQ